MKVSKELGDTLKDVINNWAANHFVVKQKAKGEVFSASYDELNAIDLDTLIRALYIGYEVEQTPEDKVRDYYNSHLRTDLSSDHYTKKAIVVTLNLLNIKISGVND